MMMFIRLLRIFWFPMMFVWFYVDVLVISNNLIMLSWLSHDLCMMPYDFLLLLWSSYDCLWFPYDVLTIVLWCCYEFLMVFLRFSMFVVWFLDMFSWFPMICVSPCPMIFVCFLMNYYDFLWISLNTVFLKILVIGIVVVVIIYCRSNRNNNNNCN